jgi:hypothetical protein
MCFSSQEHAGQAVDIRALLRTDQSALQDACRKLQLAHADPEEVAFLNPAALVHQKGYQLSTAYRDFNVREDGSIYDFMAHISENQPDTMFPLALTYHKNRNFYHSANDRSEDFHFTTANMLFDNFSIGFDVRKHKYDGPAEDKDEWDGTVGIMYILTKDLGMGLVHRNLLDSDSPYLYRTLEFGVNYIFEDFLRFVFDVVYGTEKNPDKQAIYMFGVEHKMLEGFPLRLGFRGDDVLNEEYWTLGIGWVGPKIGLDFSLERNFSETGEFASSFDLKVYF